MYLWERVGVFLVSAEEARFVLSLSLVHRVQTYVRVRQALTDCTRQNTLVPGGVGRMAEKVEVMHRKHIFRGLSRKETIVFVSTKEERERREGGARRGEEEKSVLARMMPAVHS